jgi:hypothetical protein
LGREEQTGWRVRMEENEKEAGRRWDRGSKDCKWNQKEGKYWQMYPNVPFYHH